MTKHKISFVARHPNSDMSISGKYTEVDDMVLNEKPISQQLL